MSPKTMHRHGRRVIGVVAIAASALFVLRDIQTAFAGDPPRLTFESERLGPDDFIDDRSDSLLLTFTNVGNMRLKISNAGTFGDRFDNGREGFSIEWPASSGIDHLVRAALWVGDINVTNGDTLVSSGGRDAFYTRPITEHTEFAPIHPEAPMEFSRLRNSPFFRRGTISEENMFTVYVDTLRIIKIAGGEPHTPMGIRVIQNTYGWSFDPIDDFVIAEFNVVNVGENALQDVWIGVYSEFVTNNRQWYARWPPGGAWFDFQYPEWDAERRMYLNRNKRGSNTGAPEWGGLKILGSGGRGATGRGPDSISTMQISMEAWSWRTSQFLVWDDDSLYTFMSKGVAEFPPGIPDPDNTEINPASIISVGPFSFLAPGDTAQVVFAFLAGDDRADLELNAFWAQKAYDDRYALPSPPTPPILRAYPQHREIVLRWNDDSELDPDPATKALDFQGYRVYLSETPVQRDFRLVHEFDYDNDGVGFDTGLDDILRDPPFITEEGDSLQYELRLTNIPTGFKRYVSVTAYDYQIGDPPSLEGGILNNTIYVIAGPNREESTGKRISVFPNPYRGESAFDVRNADGQINDRKRVLWFVNLPARAHIKIYTLAGDIVREYDFDAATYRGIETAGIRPDRSDLFAGRNLVSGGTMAGFDLLNADSQEIASGLYLFSVRDKDSGETQQGKFMVIR
jgi:hypothetical protein